MSLRAKILCGYAAILCLLAVMSVWAVTDLLALGRASAAILSENYRSILAAENMIDHLERQDSASLLALLGQADRLADIDFFFAPQGLGRLYLLFKALDAGMVVLGQFTGAIEGPGDLQEAEAHEVGTQGNGQIDDPDRQFQVRGGLGGMGQVPDEGDAEGADGTGKEGPGEEPEEDKLGPYRLLEVIDEHIDAHMDAARKRVEASEKGLAETVFPKAGGKPVSAFIQDALDAGVNFMACTASTELHDLTPEDLIDGVKMVGGATMWQLAEDSKTVLTF